MKYLCAYFSATGNTRRAVGVIRRRLEAAGSTVDEVRIRKGVRVPDPGGYDALIVAFPVLSFSPPVIVKRFIRSLPRAGLGGVKPPDAYVLAVDGGGGRPAAPQAERLLEARGYPVAASGCVTYPDNWAQLVQPPDAERSGQISLEGDEKTELFAGAILSGRPVRVSVARGTDILSVAVGFLFGVLGRRYLGKTYVADGDCNACGLCAAQCPKGAIIMTKGRRPRPFWKTNCEDCNACINLCPTRAINTSIGRLIVLCAAVAGCAWAGILAYYAYARAAFAGVVPEALRAAIDVAAVSAIVVAAHVIPIGPFDRYFLRFLQRAPVLRRFFEWTFTKNWRRYRAEPLMDKGRGRP